MVNPIIKPCVQNKKLKTFATANHSTSAVKCGRVWTHRRHNNWTETRIGNNKLTCYDPVLAPPIML
jgi:hypothetical protein